MFKIVFTEYGAVVREWSGYATASDAMRAVRDADLCIPFTWEWTIEAA